MYDYLVVGSGLFGATFARQACDAGRIVINGNVAKASYNVKVGDVIEISFGNKTVKVRVTDVQETVKKEEAAELFEYI